MTGASQAQVSLCVGDGGERAGGIEVAQDRDRAAHPQHGHARQVEGADVIERAGDEQPVVRRRGRAPATWSAHFQ